MLNISIDRTQKACVCERSIINRIDKLLNKILLNKSTFHVYNRILLCTFLFCARTLLQIIIGESFGGHTLSLSTWPVLVHMVLYTHTIWSILFIYRRKEAWRTDREIFRNCTVMYNNHIHSIEIILIAIEIAF